MQIRNTTILNLNINLNNNPYTRRRLIETGMAKKTATNFMAQYINFPNLKQPLIAPFMR